MRPPFAVSQDVLVLTQAGNLSRRAIAARYRTADWLHAKWQSPHTRPLALAFAVALGCAAATELSGVSEVLDSEVRTLLHPLDPSTTEGGAVVVSIDSVADLAERARLTARIEAGSPRALVQLPALGDPGRDLGLAPSGGRFERARCGGAVGDGLRQLGVACIEGSLLRFAAQGEATTVVPARAVLDGSIPAGAFSRAIVVVGESQRSETISTPRGELTAPEALAQVLGAAAHGRGVREVRGAALGAAMVCVIALTLAFLRVRRRRVRRIALLTFGLLSLSIALFTVHGVAFGPTTPLVGAVTATLALAIVEARVVARRLGGLVVRLERVEANEIDRARYPAIARLAAAQLGAHGSLVFQLPVGKWHVKVVGADGTTEAALLEGRRDVRRDPYREALRAGHVTRERFLADATHTVLVPLVAERQTLGFWAVGFRGAAPDVGAVTRRAAEISAGLLHAEQEAAAAAERRGFVAVPDRLEHLDAASLALASRVRRFAHVLDALPLPVLIAGPWGTIERSNAAMRRLLSSLAVDPGEKDLVRMLGAIAGLDDARSVALVRRAMQGTTVSVPVVAGSEAAAALELCWTAGDGVAPGTLTLAAFAAEPDEAPVAGVPRSGPLLRILFTEPEGRGSDPGGREAREA